MAATASAPRPAGTSSATNAQSAPAAAKAALRITGDNECRTGCPMTAARRVAPVITPRPPSGASAAPQAHVGALGLQLLELVVGRREGVVAVLAGQHGVEAGGRV